MFSISPSFNEKSFNFCIPSSLSFLDLFKNEDTRDLAYDIIHYAMIKDGLQNRVSSFLKALPADMLDGPINAIARVDDFFKIREEKFRNTYNLVNKAKMKHAYLNLDKEIQTETLDYLDNINHATGNMLYTLSLGTVKLAGQALWLGGNVTNGIGNALQNSVDNDGTYEDDVLKGQVSGVKTITQGLRDGADYFYELSEKGEKYKKKQPVGFSGFQALLKKVCLVFLKIYLT